MPKSQTLSSHGGLRSFFLNFFFFFFSQRFATSFCIQRASRFQSFTTHTKKLVAENFFNLWKSICGLLSHSSLVLVGLDQNLLEKNHVLGMFEAESMEKRYTMRKKILNWCNLVSISKNALFYTFLVVRIY